MANESKVEMTLKEKALAFIYSERVKAFDDANDERTRALDDVYRFIKNL